MVPRPAGSIVQVTAVLLVFATLAVNCCVCPPVSVALLGARLIVTAGVKVTVAEIDLVESPRMVAVTGTVCCDEMLSGAVYKPLVVSVPGMPAGIDQIATGELHEPGTEPRTVNCRLCAS